MNNAGNRPDERWSAAWQALRDHDSQLEAPPHLEASVMAALNGPRRNRGVLRSQIFAACAASIAAVAAMWTMTGPREKLAPTLLEARTTMPVVPLAPAIDAMPVTIGSALIAPRPVKHAPPAEDTVVLTMFEPLPASPAESLQLVRLRVPGEALLALGLPPFEPDASGLVDIDMLVGDDGLPRNIRKVRVEQEKR